MKGFDYFVNLADLRLKLTRVEYFVEPDVPGGPVAVRICFGNGSAYVCVNPDYDTLSVSDSPPAGPFNLQCIDVSREAPWNSALGMRIQWIWRMQNQQGYEDGIQIEFHLEDSAQSLEVQFIAIGSHISVRRVL